MPVVVMDEAGHTGENLLDSVQPVYALAAVQMDEATARAAVSDALGRAPETTTELKFSALRRSSAGRRNLLTLLPRGTPPACRPLGAVTAGAQLRAAPRNGADLT